MSGHRANVRCADGMVHDVRVWKTTTAACGVIVFDLPPGVGPRLLGSRTRIVRAAGPATDDPVDCMACVAGLDRTPYAVLCHDHGQQFLSEREYEHQLNRPNALWTCPRCGEAAYWDDDEYEAAMDLDGPGPDD